MRPKIYSCIVFDLITPMLIRNAEIFGDAGGYWDFESGEVSTYTPWQETLFVHFVGLHRLSLRFVPSTKNV